MNDYNCTDLEHSIQDDQTAYSVYCPATSHADRGYLEVCIAGLGKSWYQ